jgi:hypothetical protein
MNQREHPMQSRWVELFKFELILKYPGQQVKVPGISIGEGPRRL